MIPRLRADDSAGLQVDSDPLDVAQLETQLRQRVDPADAETNYQMALGLVEMGLDGQALPLLEGLLGDPARQIDATLLLVRVRRARGEVRRALKEAVAVLHAAGPAHIDLQAALTATIVELALETKRLLEARSFVEHLAHIAPNYPELPRLLARVEQSER